MKVVPLHRVEGGLPEMSDEALVAACGVGELAALGALYDRYATVMRRFLARTTGHQDRDLDDLVQTTFETAARAARGFDGRSAVRTWLFGIANNAARHHIRTEARRRRLADATALAVKVSPGVTDELAERERSERLHAAILELPPKLREAFVLVYLEGLSGAEVARLLGTRDGAIWKRLHEARARLRAALEGARS